MPIDPIQWIGKQLKAFPYDANKKGVSVLVLPIVSGAEVVGYLPAAAEDNGDGTASLKVESTGGGGGGDTNVVSWGGTSQTGADLTPHFQHLDVDLSTRATEATLALIKAKTDNLDATLSSRATEATLLSVLSKLNDIFDKIDTIVSGETPAGAVDGLNDTFTTADNFKPTTTHLYKNGVRQHEGPGNDYIEEVDHITLTFAVAPLLGDVLIVDYVKE